MGFYDVTGCMFFMLSVLKQLQSIIMALCNQLYACEQATYFWDTLN